MATKTFNSSEPWPPPFFILFSFCINHHLVLPRNLVFQKASYQEFPWQCQPVSWPYCGDAWCGRSWWCHPEQGSHCAWLKTKPSNTYFFPSCQHLKQGWLTTSVTVRNVNVFMSQAFFRLKSQSSSAFVSTRVTVATLVILTATRTVRIITCCFTGTQ